MSLVSPCKSGRIDPVWYALFKEVESKIPIVVVTKMEDYIFNDELYKLERYILVCGCEYGWSEEFDIGTHIWGDNTDWFEQFNSNEWKRFEEFVNKKSPILVFKRELIEGDNPENYFPINYPCWHPIPHPQSRSEFDKRKIQCNFIWGFSHERRKTLHAEIWQRSSEFDYMVCDNLAIRDLFIQHESNPKKWLTVNTPWFARYDMSHIIETNGMSKISISINGAGRHCFRDSESSINSVMYRWEDSIKFSYPWVNGVNCIKSKPGEELQTIVAALNNHNLYEIYLQGVENCRKYYLPDYIANYIQPIIKEHS